MTTTGNHSVGSSECISSLAEKSGVPWDVIWNAPENARLRALRPNPNVLAAGDLLFVPAPEEQEFSAATDKRHTFREFGAVVKLRLVLYNDHGARANEPYVLEIGAIKKSGVTSGRGTLEETIPAAAEEAFLILGEGERYELRLGALDPVDSERGVGQRLENLGYMNRVNTNGEAPPAAIGAFQQSRSLEVTGFADEQTRQSLVATHGS
jgi:hypothetical protein